MSEINFPLKDLTRRKHQTTLTIVGLTISISATVFLVLFGNNLGFDLTHFSHSNQLTSGFYAVFSQFIQIVIILNIVTGAIVTSFLVHLMMSTRMRDIGIMKASGCLTDSVFACYFTELSLIVVFSTVIGTILGITSYYLSTLFLNMVGFYVSQRINVLSVLIVIGLSLVFAHVFGALPLKKAAKAKSTDAMSPVSQQESIASVGNKFPSQLGFTLKVVYRNLVRRQSSTIQAILCFTAVFSMITVTITGGLIANDTTISYVERAIGKNVVIIGHSTITERYVEFLSQFFESDQMEQLDYLDPKYLISDQFLTKLENIQETSAVDARLLLEKDVREVLGVVLDPIEQSEATFIGGDRTETALVLGIHPNKVVNDWVFFGKKVGVNEQNVVMVGDSLARNMFEDAINQRIRVFEESEVPYDVMGICIDPLNSGNVVYLPIQTLYTDSGKHGYNLIFIQTNPNNPEVFKQINKIAHEENLSIVKLDNVLSKHTQYLRNVWSLVMLLPLFTLVTALIVLFSYLNLSISGQQHEFGIMKALGAKRKTISKIIFCQATVIVLVTGLIGILAGTFTTFNFFLPNPTISPSTINVVLILLVSILTLLCLSSMYPAVKEANKKVLDSISSN